MRSTLFIGCCEFGTACHSVIAYYSVTFLWVISCMSTRATISCYQTYPPYCVQTIMLLLGGFAIASAFTKHSIARRFAVWALSRISTRPHVVLLASMFLATITSMFITNVAAPVLCFSVLDPILRTLPSGHSFGKALVLGERPCALVLFLQALMCLCNSMKSRDNVRHR